MSRNVHSGLNIDVSVLEHGWVVFLSREFPRVPGGETNQWVSLKATEWKCLRELWLEPSFSSCTRTRSHMHARTQAHIHTPAQHLTTPPSARSLLPPNQVRSFNRVHSLPAPICSPPWEKSNAPHLSVLSAPAPPLHSSPTGVHLYGLETRRPGPSLHDLFLDFWEWHTAEHCLQATGKKLLWLLFTQLIVDTNGHVFQCSGLLIAQLLMIATHFFSLFQRESFWAFWAAVDHGISRQIVDNVIVTLTFNPSTY